MAASQSGGEVTAQIKYIDRRICVCFPGLWAFGGGFKIQGGSG